jgi:hypothetical protein
MKFLKQDLTVAPLAQVNGDVQVNDDKISSQPKKMRQKRMRCQNAVMIVARMPLESISLHGKNSIFRKLLLLDQAVVAGDTDILPKKSDKVKFLLLIRRTLMRYVTSIIKIMTEVFHAGSLPNFKENGFINTLFGLYKSLDKFSSNELRSVTMNLGETLLW